MARLAANRFDWEVIDWMPHDRAGTIAVGPDSSAPARFDATIRIGEPYSLTVELTIALAPLADPMALRLDVKADRGKLAPITSTLLRTAIPVETLVRIAVNHVKAPAQTPPPPKTDRGAELAADIYAAAVQAGSHRPTEVTAEQMGMSRSQASRYIREARDQGLLP